MFEIWPYNSSKRTCTHIKSSNIFSEKGSISLESMLTYLQKDEIKCIHLSFFSNRDFFLELGWLCWYYCVNLFQVAVVVRRMLGWLGVHLQTMGGWRCFTVECGGPCVMTRGITGMLVLSVSCWDTPGTHS